MRNGKKQSVQSIVGHLVHIIKIEINLKCLKYKTIFVTMFEIHHNYNSSYLIGIKHNISSVLVDRNTL